MTNINWVNEAERQWGERADTWHSSSKQMWEIGSRKDIIPFLIKHLSDTAAICDIGCGDGYASYKLATMDFQVTGVDLSEQMLEKARDRAKNTSGQFYKADISDLPLESSFSMRLWRLIH